MTKIKNLKNRLNKMNKNIPEVYTVHSIINFGKKWKGTRMEDVVALDPHYLQYMGENFDILFDNHLYEEITNSIKSLGDMYDYNFI